MERLEDRHNQIDQDQKDFYKSFANQMTLSKEEVTQDDYIENDS